MTHPPFFSKKPMTFVLEGGFFRAFQKRDYGGCIYGGGTCHIWMMGWVVFVVFFCWIE